MNVPRNHVDTNQVELEENLQKFIEIGNCGLLHLSSFFFFRFYFFFFALRLTKPVSAYVRVLPAPTHSHTNIHSVGSGTYSVSISCFISFHFAAKHNNNKNKITFLFFCFLLSVCILFSIQISREKGKRTTRIHDTRMRENKFNFSLSILPPSIHFFLAGYKIRHYILPLLRVYH